MMEAEEMVAIARAVFSAEFGKLGWMRDDLISEGVLGIVAGEKNYSDDRGMKESTYAWNCARGRMLAYYRKEKRHHEKFGVVSAEDVMAYEGEVDPRFFRLTQKEGVEKLIEEMNDSGSEKTRAIVDDFISGDTQVKIAQRHGVSRQRVSELFRKLRKRVREKYKYEDGEIKERYDKETGI